MTTRSPSTNIPPGACILSRFQNVFSKDGRSSVRQMANAWAGAACHLLCSAGIAGSVSIFFDALPPAPRPQAGFSSKDSSAEDIYLLGAGSVPWVCRHSQGGATRRRAMSLVRAAKGHRSGESSQNGGMVRRIRSPRPERRRSASLKPSL